MARKTPLKTRARILGLAVATCFVANGADALPVLPAVVNGSAAIAQTGATLNITNSNGAIINWQTFNIGQGEAVRFIQSSASSSVLNRVLANDPSLIYGALSSNGRVWLVNPAGILVGATGRVDTAGFVASALPVSNQDFLANKLTFGNGAIAASGSVNNHGVITTPLGGSVYLIGANIENKGLIQTPAGETILAAGQTVQLLDTATPGVSVEITGNGQSTNLGTILADAGRIGLVGSVVKNSGTLNASSVVNEGGRIFLKASQDSYVDGSGRIVTTGSKGGQVEVLGNRVAVMNQASIDASGENGGGTVLLGGDYQGKNAAVQNSNVTYFGKDASIRADATRNGNGGKVIVWADDTTRAYGSISARGGEVGGNGGFVETSGHRYLDVNGINISTKATNGDVGTWLLDPYTLTIADYSGSNSNITYGSSVFSDAGVSSQLDVGQLNTALTNSAISVTTTENLIVAAPITGSSNSLTLTANTGDLIINDEITLGSGNFYGTAGNAITMNSGSGINASTVKLVSGAGGITTAASGGVAGGSNNVFLAGYIALDSAGTINIAALDGDFVARTTGAGSNITISDPGGMTVSSSNLGGFGSGVQAAGGTVKLKASGGVLSIAGSVNSGAGGTLELEAASSYSTNIAAGYGVYGGNAVIKTDNIDIAGVIDTTSSVTITRKTDSTGSPVELQLGGSSVDNATTLAISATELGKITTPIYRFGDTTTAGGLRVFGSLSLPGKTLSLLTSTQVSSQIIQEAGATITVDKLRAQGTAVTLNEANAVTKLAGKTLGQNFSFTNSAPISLDTVDGQAGIDAGSNNVTLTTTGAGNGVTSLTGATISANTLSITAPGGISLLEANNVDTFTADVSSSGVGSGVYLKNSKSLNIGASGISTYMATGEVGLSLMTGNLTQSGAVSASDLVVRADQGYVDLSTVANSISNVAAQIGTTSTYENQYFRLRGGNGFQVGAGLIADTNFSGISGINLAISGTYSNGSNAGVIDLRADTGNITQASGALLAGKAVRALASATTTSGSVLLTQANPTGIIAGSAGAATYGGDFKYSSSNGVYVTTVGAVGNQSIGISTPNAAALTLLTSSSNISQDAPISTKSLAVESATGVSLTNASNSVATLAGTVTGTGNFEFSQTGESALTVGTSSGVVGLNGGTTALNGSARVHNKYAGGSLTVTSKVNVAADKEALLAAPGTLGITAEVYGGSIILRSDAAISITAPGGAYSRAGTNPGEVQLSAYTPGTAIEVSAAPGGAGLKIDTDTSIARINSPWVVFGSKDSVYGSGYLWVQNIDASSSFGAVPSVLGFLSADGYNIQLDNISISSGTLGATSGNNLTGTGLQAGTIVAETRNTGDTINLAFSSGITVGSLTVPNWDGVSETYNGVRTNNGGLTLTASAGNIAVNQPVAAGTGSVWLTASGATISGTGGVKGNSLNLTSAGNIGTAGSPFLTAASLLRASSTSGSIYITNNTSANPAAATLFEASASSGSVNVSNWGAFTVGDCGDGCYGVTTYGNIDLSAHSPLTVSGPVSSSGGGGITLTADSGGAITINQSVTTSGSIAFTGGSVGGSVTVSGATFSSNAASGGGGGGGSAAPPTLSQCTTNPSLSGCSAVLPTVASCTTDPTQAGCTSVLPTLSTCTTTPTAAGCTAVLPSIASCTTTPTLAGCTAVLPTLNACTTNPAAAGCAAVLPSIASCTTTPTLAGCTAVLPTLNACTTTPAAAGCAAVLPSIASCTTAPTTAGCSVVIPASVASCSANPSQEGCTTVKNTETTSKPVVNEVVNLVTTVAEKSTDTNKATTATTVFVPVIPGANSGTLGNNFGQTIGGTPGTFGSNDSSSVASGSPSSSSDSNGKSGDTNKDKNKKTNQDKSPEKNEPKSTAPTPKC